MKRVLMLSLAASMLAACGTGFQTAPTLNGRNSPVQAQSRDVITQEIARLANKCWLFLVSSYPGNTNDLVQHYTLLNNRLPSFPSTDGYHFKFSYLGQTLSFGANTTHNGNWILSRQYFIDAFTAQSNVGSIQRTIEEMGNQTDSNKDGKLSRAEFYAGIDKKLINATKASFDDANKDWPRDEFLTYSEFENAVFTSIVDSLP